MRPFVPVLACALSASAVALAAGPSVKAEMKALVDPATNVVFAVGGEVDPANGPDAGKVPAARWDEALAAANKLKVAAVHLTGYQKRPGKVWTTSAADFARLASAAEAAARKHDGAAFSKAANDLGDTCTACHAKYKKQTG